MHSYLDLHDDVFVLVVFNTTGIDVAQSSAFAKLIVPNIQTDLQLRLPSFRRLHDVVELNL